MKKILKNALALTLTLCTLLSLFSCSTPLGTGYWSSEEYDLTAEEDATAITEILNSAEAKNEALNNIKYTYDFYIEYETDDDTLKLGTKNVISIKDKNLSTMTAHRQNSYTSLKNGTTQSTQNEDFYYSGGKIYTKRFGKNYSGALKGEEFLPYTEYSDISVNTEFLSEIFFEKATVYDCFDGITEIVFIEAHSYLNTAIASFVGLDKTDYKYEVNEVILTVSVNSDGYMNSRQLKFRVDYYNESSPNNVITYYGTFAYTLDATEDFEVTARPSGVSYTDISYINLLSSLSENGYKILFDHTAISATYKKSIKVTDTEDNEYTYTSFLDIRSLIKDGKYYYSSVDTENFLKDYPAKEDEYSFDTVGIFINDNTYSERRYDYVKSEMSEPIDRTEHDYTVTELYSIMNTALGAEQLSENEIFSFAVAGEDENTVTFSVVFTNYATKYFAGYLIDTFLDDINVDSYGFSFDKCDIFITVRKSDGCLIKQVIDYKGSIFQVASSNYTITAEGKVEFTVNSTENNFEMLTEQDFDNEVNSNK